MEANTTKLFEIRDAGTFIPAMGIRLLATSEAERFLLSRAGFGRHTEDQCHYIILIKLSGGEGEFYCDPRSWNTRTMSAAHSYIVDNWHELPTGAVIDVEWIMGMNPEPRLSERLEYLT